MSLSIVSLGWALFHFLWEGSALAALLGLGLLWTRKRNPNLRYALACAALGLMALCPIATYWAMTRDLTPAAASRPALASASAALSNLRLAPAPPLVAVLRAVEPRLPSLVFVWMAGVALLSLRMAGGLLEIERLKRRGAKPASAQWQCRLFAIADRVGVKRRVRLLESVEVDAPSAFGLLKATILVPCSALAHLPQADVEALLAHELAHIRRHDYAVNLLQTLVETALFYHPAVWWTSRVIRQEREHCCDDIAIAATGDRMVYARALASLEEHRVLKTQLSLAAVGGSLMFRIRRILGLSSSPNHFALSWAPYLFALALLAPLAQTVRGQSPDANDGPEITISAAKAGGTSAFHELLANPSSVVRVGGKARATRDLTPVQREKLEAYLTRLEAKDDSKPETMSAIDQALAELKKAFRGAEPSRVHEGDALSSAETLSGPPQFSVLSAQAMEKIARGGMAMQNSEQAQKLALEVLSDLKLQKLPGLSAQTSADIQANIQSAVRDAMRNQDFSVARPEAGQTIDSADRLSIAAAKEALKNAQESYQAGAITVDGLSAAAQNLAESQTRAARSWTISPGMGAAESKAIANEALQLALKSLKDAQGKFNLGAASSQDVSAAAQRVAEAQERIAQNQLRQLIVLAPPTGAASWSLNPTDMAQQARLRAMASQLAALEREVKQLKRDMAKQRKAKKPAKAS